MTRPNTDLVEQRYHAFLAAILDHVRSYQENELENAEDFSKQIQQFTNSMKVMRKHHRHTVFVTLSNEIDVSGKNNEHTGGVWQSP